MKLWRWLRRHNSRPMATAKLIALPGICVWFYVIIPVVFYLAWLLARPYEILWRKRRMNVPW